MQIFFITDCANGKCSTKPEHQKRIVDPNKQHTARSKYLTMFEFLLRHSQRGSAERIHGRTPLEPGMFICACIYAWAHGHCHVSFQDRDYGTCNQQLCMLLRMCKIGFAVCNIVNSGQCTINSRQDEIGSK